MPASSFLHGRIGVCPQGLQDGYSTCRHQIRVLGRKNGGKRQGEDSSPKPAESGPLNQENSSF